MMNEGGPYNLDEIWQFPMNGRTVETAAMSLFGGPSLGHFGNSNLNSSIGSDPACVNHVHVPLPAAAASGISVSRKRRDAAEDESTMVVSTSNSNSNCAEDSGSKRQRASDCGEEEKAKADVAGMAVEQKKQPPEHLKDYIHVRARRGQATDSHSLAERARREKISERMRILQDIVPGCNKVIGKALVLDEIINYIQSLQRQVEFLSMKLEAVDARMNTGLVVFPPKEFGDSGFENPDAPFGSEPANEYSRRTSPEWLHMQVGGGFDRTS